jgi:hypothetical protein
VAAIIAAARSGRDWTILLLRDANGEADQIPHVASCPLPRLESEAAPRDLRGAIIEAVDFSGETAFADTAFDASKFVNVQFNDASITGSRFDRSTFSDNCSFTSCVGVGSSFRGCDCRGVSFYGANLAGADLSRCDLRDSDLRDTNLARAIVTLEGALGFLYRRNWTRFGGDYQALVTLHPKTARWLRRHIAEEAEAESTRRRHRMWGTVLYILSNHGRSAGRVGYWAVAVWLLFASLYTALPVPRALFGTKLGSMLSATAPMFGVGSESVYLDFWSALYFSTVTITTLGYGDITPGNAIARGFAAAEAFCGVVLLGVFVALLVQTTTTRSD